MRSRGSDILLCGSICLIVVVLLSSVFMDGFARVVGAPSADMGSMFYPLRDFVHREMGAGRLPLWNPYLFCGQPLHAEGQAGIFEPVGFVLSVLPVAFAINLYAGLHLALGGVFLFLYLRSVRVSRWAAFPGALIFLLSSAPVSRLYAGHYSVLPLVAIVPGLLWAWQRWRDSGGMAWLAAAAVLYATGVLAGYPQGLFYTTIYMGWHLSFDTAHGIWVSWKRAGHRGAASAGFVLLFLGFVAALGLGVGIGAVQLLPTLDYAARSFRQDATYEFCSVFSLAPESLITFLAPGFFGDAIRSPYWGRNYLWEMWGYVGIVPLALGAVVALRPRGRVAYVHAIALPLFLVLAFGRHTPLLRFLYGYVPGFDLFRGTSKFLFFFVLSLSVLSALGMERLITEGNGATRRGVACVLGVFLLTGVAALWVFGVAPESAGSPWRAVIGWRATLGEDYAGFFRDPSFWPPAGASWAVARGWLLRLSALSAAGVVVMLFWPRIVRRPVVAALILAALVVPDLYLFCRAYVVSTDTTIPPLPAAILNPIAGEAEPARVYSGLFPGNEYMLRQIESIQGYVGLLAQRTNDYLTAVSGYEGRTDMVASPPPRAFTPAFLGANVRYLILADNDLPPSSLADRISEDRGIALYRVKSSYPRARFAERITRVGSRTEARAMVAAEAMAAGVGRSDVVEAATAKGLPADPPPGGGSAGTIRFLERTANRVVLETDTDRPRLLVLYDTWEPGWRCVVDGAGEIPIYPVNVAFRGVAAPAGRHRLEFVYRPAPFLRGAGISVASLLGLGGLVVFGLRRRGAAQAIEPCL